MYTHIHVNKEYLIQNMVCMFANGVYVVYM